VKEGQISREIGGFSIASQQILVVSQIGKWEVKERLQLQNLRIDHVVIRSELKYLIRAIIVKLKCRVFGGKTGSIAMVRVLVW